MKKTSNKSHTASHDLQESMLKLPEHITADHYHSFGSQDIILNHDWDYIFQRGLDREEEWRNRGEVERKEKQCEYSVN